MSIAVGLSATKTDFALIKSARELLTRSEIDVAEVQARLLELQGLMLDARDALNEAAEQRQALESEVVELKRMAEIGKEFERSDGVYWYQKYPYCPTCCDVDKKPVRLAGPALRQFNGNRDVWTCPLHKPEYMIQGGVFRERQQ